MSEIIKTSFASDVAEELELASAAYASDVAGEVDAGNVCGQDMATAINEREQGGYTLRVCSFNIGHFNQGVHGVGISDISDNNSDGYPQTLDRNYAVQLGRWSRFIGGIKADIIGMPEWSDYFGYNNNVRVSVADTGIFSGYNLSVGKDAQHSGDGANIAMWKNTLATKGLTITNVSDINLDIDTGVAQAYIRLGTAQIAGKSVKIGVTHLNLNSSQRHHDARVVELRNLVKMFQDDPYVILCGDFNTDGPYGSTDYILGASEFDIFVDGLDENSVHYNGISTYGQMVNSKVNPLLTYAATGGRPDRVDVGKNQPYCYLDNIIVKGFSMSNIKVLNQDVFNTPSDPLDVGMLSDHCAVVADLTIM